MSNRFIRCPNNRSVLVNASTHTNGIAVTHSGSEQDLIAAGVATADMFAVRNGNDARGNRFRILRPFSRRKGQSLQRWWVYRSELSLDNALRLNGVREALAASGDTGSCWSVKGRDAPPLRPAALASRGHLRLVVDNMREVRI